jgi:hypothetical protein
LSERLGRGIYAPAVASKLMISTIGAAFVQIAHFAAKVIIIRMTSSNFAFMPRDPILIRQRLFLLMFANIMKE